MGATTSIVRHLVVVALSEAAQRAAARAGRPAGEVQSYEIPSSTPEQERLALIGRALDLGAEVEANGAVVLAHRAERHSGEWRATWVSQAPDKLPTRPETAGEALDLIAAVREAYHRDLDAKAREALAVVLAEGRLPNGYSEKPAIERGRLTPQETAQYEAHVAAINARQEAERERKEAERERKEAEADAEVRERVERWLAGAQVTSPFAKYESEARVSLRRLGLLEKVEEEQSRREKAAEERKAVTKLARLVRLAELVRECSKDTNVLGRLATPNGGNSLGLLSEDEALEIVRDVKLPVPEGLLDFSEDMIDEDDARSECERDGCDAVFDTDDAPDHLSADEWEETQGIRAALAKAGIREDEGRLRLRLGSCECKGVRTDVVRRPTIRVVRDLGGGVKVDREYTAVGSRS